MASLTGIVASAFLSRLSVSENVFSKRTAKPMTGRERARLMLNHQEADRPAIDLGSTEITGMSAWTYRSLRRALGLKDGPVRVYNMIEMLAEVEGPVLDALGVDFAMLPPSRLRFGLSYGQWKEMTFWDGQSFDVPGDFISARQPNGDVLTSATPGGPLEWRMPQGGRFFDQEPSAQWDPLALEKPAETEWRFQEHIPDWALREQENLARELRSSTDRAIVAMPPVSTPNGYGGFLWFGAQMRQDPMWCSAYLMREAEAAATCFEEYLQAVGDYVDVLIINVADYGMQESEWFHPDLFGEHFVPAWKVCTDTIRRFPDIKTFDHCCGSIPNLVRYFIEAGVDCLNPVQWSAAGMDLAQLKADYGDDLVFWGAAVNTQGTFPFGTANQVALETQHVLDIMCPGGGYVVNPIHNVLPEVPIENIIALYQTAKDYRYADH